MSAKGKDNGGKLKKALGKSPINYFSDLFIVAMVLAWIFVLIIMVIFAVYSTMELADTSIWPDLANLVAIPLSCGGAIWMIKNSVQHAIMNKQGKQCPEDFPAVNASDEIDGQEKPLQTAEESTDGESSVG